MSQRRWPATVPWLDALKQRVHLGGTVDQLADEQKDDARKCPRKLGRARLAQASEQDHQDLAQVRLEHAPAIRITRHTVAFRARRGPDGCLVSPRHGRRPAPPPPPPGRGAGNYGGMDVASTAKIVKPSWSVDCLVIRRWKMPRMAMSKFCSTIAPGALTM